MVENLYVHFPFCRRKCSYCALYSRAGVSQADRDAYVRRLSVEIGTEGLTPRASLKTVYFGGGSPAFCDLRPMLSALSSRLSTDCEFTVELHPLDVTEGLLETLRGGGVNRISMGVQSLNDATLVDMGRGYSVDEAERAFALVKKHFDNAGIDLIVGYSKDEPAWRLERLKSWGLKHCSVYSLQNERGLKNVMDDDAAMDRIAVLAEFLKDIGLERYEISNYAVPEFECRHNLAVWRGEDYIGLGEGACGRNGLKRTKSSREELVSEDFDRKERRLFRLRTREGLDATGFPEWGQTLAEACKNGLLTKSGSTYYLTDRGREVCDSILSELV